MHHMREILLINSFLHDKITNNTENNISNKLNLDELLIVINQVN